MAVLGGRLVINSVPQCILKAVADDHCVAAVGICEVIKMQQLDTSVFLRKYRECFFKDTNLKEYLVRESRHTVFFFKAKCFGGLKMDSGA